MPGVLVVPIYVEVPDVGRAVLALESLLERAGYIFHVGDPVTETLEETRRRVTHTEPTRHGNDGAVRARVSP
jgi:hypothetical protein